jgi:predicted dehydrogenase
VRVRADLDAAAKPALNPAMTPKLFNVSRRTFLHRVSALAASTGLPLWFLERELSAAEPARGPLGPNDRPGIALVGCGGMGRGDANNAQRFGDLVAVCDVDESHVEAAAKQFTKDGKAPAKLRDFRKVMERDDVHVVIQGCPDHWHTLVNLAAVRAKKDVYGEKPLTLTIDEGRRLVKAVRENRAVLQTGSQQRSDNRFRLACELVRNGRLGRLKTVTVYLPAGLRGGPFPVAPVPAGLDWDYYLGQAPKVDYVKERCHTTFRYWWDYSGGTMTDWGAHHNDIARWAIGEEGPTAVEARALAQPVAGGYTAFSDYEVTFTWGNGVQHIVRSTPDDNIFGGVVKRDGQRNGLRFEGTDGWLWVTRGDIDASDDALITTPLPAGAVKLESSGDHMANFFECVRSRKDPIAHVEVGHRSVSVCHLGVIALRVGRKLTWDVAKETFVGDGAADANAYVTREMRKPYDYSFIG